MGFTWVTDIIGNLVTGFSKHSELPAHNQRERENKTVHEKYFSNHLRFTF